MLSGVHTPWVAAVMVRPGLSRPARGATATGFTLVELIIALAVIGILAAIALPSYVESVRKSRRGDAMAALLAVQQAQERHRANHVTYAESLSELVPPIPDVSPEGHYRLTISSVSASGYTATATAASGSPQAGDARCRAMSLTHAGGRTRYDATGGAQCWSRRESS